MQLFGKLLSDELGQNIATLATDNGILLKIPPGFDVEFQMILALQAAGRSSGQGGRSRGARDLCFTRISFFACVAGRKRQSKSHAKDDCRRKVGRNLIF